MHPRSGVPGISFDVFDQCVCKVVTRACEKLRSYAKH